MKTARTTLVRDGYPIVALVAIVLMGATMLIPQYARAEMLTGQLDLGMRSANVTTLQEFLAQYPSIYPEGLVTGYFGPLTQSAVVRYQSSNGIDAVGRVGPVTLSLINSRMDGGTGGSDDESAPIMNTESVSVGTNSATIGWSLNESAQSRVMFSRSWPFLYASAPSVSNNGYTPTASITITGLQSRTTYYYVRESVDVSGNVTLTLAHTFTTL